MGRVYRQLLRQALHSLGAALAHVKAAPEIGPQEVQQMEYAMQAYHDHLGRFGAIFGEYQPADLVEVQRLHQVSREIELKRQLLDSQGANLELSLCPLLCAPMTWAASKWSTSKAKAEGMLKYTEWRLEQREGRPALSRSSHPPAPSTGTPTRRSTARSSV